MANVLDCSLIVSEFELQWYDYIPFQVNTLRKAWTLLSPIAMGWIVSLLFFYKVGFGIKWPTKVDMPLIKANQSKIMGLPLFTHLYYNPHNKSLYKFEKILLFFSWSSLWTQCNFSSTVLEIHQNLIFNNFYVIK